MHQEKRISISFSFSRGKESHEAQDLESADHPLPNPSEFLPKEKRAGKERGTAKDRVCN
jgi:hypothetical protein